MALFPTNATQIQTFATALYGVQVGSTTLAQVNNDILSSGGLNNALNAYYTASFGTATTASVAQTIATNVGLGTDTNAVAFITAQLNAAAPAARGAAVIAMLDNFLNTTTGTYAAAAATFNTTVATAVAYTGAANVAAGTVTPATFTLTTNGTGSTFISGVSIPAGTLVLNDLAGTGTDTISLPAGAVVAATSLVINGASTDGIVANTSGAAWGSVNSVTVNGGGLETLTGSSTQDINATSSATGAITIDGGKAVTSTSTATTGAAVVALGSVAIGGTTAPVGAVNVTNTQSFVTATSTLGNITVSGGVGATVNSTVNQSTALSIHNGATGADEAAVITVAPTSGAVVISNATNIKSLATIATFADAIAVTGGSTVNVTEAATQIATATGISSITNGVVGVIGDATTTAVTVTQDAVATGTLKAAAVAAVNGVDGVTAQTAAPGINALAAVTQTTTAAASAATLSAPTITMDGAVTIADKNAGDATKAATIATVTLNNFGDSTISSNALSNLTLTGTGGTVGITNGLTAPTSTTLNLSVNNLTNTGGGATTNKITDVSNYIKTLNITTGATASSILAAATWSTAAFAGTALTTVNVSGSSVLTMGAWTTAPTTVTVTGAAGYSGYITGTTTAFNAAGSTGKATVAITVTPTKAITGASGAADEIVVDAAAVVDSTVTAANLAKFNANVTGFEVLGVTTNLDAKTIDMSTLSSSFNALDVKNTTALGGGNAGVTFTNVAAGTSLTLAAANTGTVVYQLADTNGAADSVSVTVAASPTALTLQDANSVGIGNVSLNVTGTSTIGTLTDTALSNLTVTGSKALTITTFTSDLATALTITNNNTVVPASAAAAVPHNPTLGALKITTLTDNNLGSLSFAGSAKTVITTLNDTAPNITINSTDSAAVEIGTLAATGGASRLTFTGTGSVDVGILTTTAATVTIANNGTGTVTVGDEDNAGFVDANITTLTLTGNVAFGTDSATTMTTVGGVNLATIAAGTDNAHINVKVGAIANGTAATYTFGNGNDFFTSASTAGQLTATFGTGYNLVDLSAGSAATYSANVTFGAHTSTATLFDNVKVGVVAAAAVTPSTVITGFAANDQITYAAATVSSGNVTTAQQTTLAVQTTLGNAITTAMGLTGANIASLEFQYGGNTYVVVNGGGTAHTTTLVTDSIIELVGLHTAATGTTVITQAS